MSMSPPRAINGNIASTPPGQHVAIIRSVEFVALPQACGMCLGSVTVVPAGASNVSSPRTMRAVPSRMRKCSSSF